MPAQQTNTDLALLLQTIQTYWEKLQNLKTLAPGYGYDEIGHGICDLVLSPHYTTTEKSACIAELKNRSPQMLRDIQNASIHSEMKLESALIDAAGNKLEPLQFHPEADFFDKAILRKNALNNLLVDYPFSWAEPLACEEIWLLQNAGRHAIPAPEQKVIYWGRSMLPFSALHMHYLTQAQIIWLDPEPESAANGAAFIEQLVANNYLDSPSAIQIYQWDCQSGLDSYVYDKDIAGLIILDSDLITESCMAAIDIQDIPNVIATDTNGLAELMYPAIDSNLLSEQRKLTASVYPHHCEYPQNPENATIKHSRSPYQFKTLHSFIPIHIEKESSFPSPNFESGKSLAHIY